MANEELGCEVFHVHGVCWFHVWGKLQLPPGAFKVGFRVKRLPDLHFRVPIVLLLNGEETRRVKLEDELDAERGWELLEVGTFQAGGEVNIEMKGADCSEGGQGGKNGLLIDLAIATPI
mmetsp:Transcript_5277/g.19862  ORF Transcript_5277/g.19862 Transcript_5277/m.19862 type:complete len:119 (+) Transcript_5277:323-679(+)